MEVGLFIFGLLLGGGLAWFLLERYREDEAKEREAGFDNRLRQLQDQLKEADSANGETRERLIALQMEHKALAERMPALEAELAQTRQRAEQAAAAERQAGEIAAGLRAEIERLQRQRQNGAITADRAAMPDTAESLPSAITVPAAGLGPEVRDDLTRIKGIGKVIERKLNELGITTFRQLASLSPEDVHRINTVLDFPGRIEREHWVEQARSLSGA